MAEVTVLASDSRSSLSLWDFQKKYERVITRRNRLNRLRELRAPEIVIRNEQRLITAAVKELFEDAEDKAIVTPIGAAVFAESPGYLAEIEGPRQAEQTADVFVGPQGTGEVT